MTFEKRLIHPSIYQCGDVILYLISLNFIDSLAHPAKVPCCPCIFFIIIWQSGHFRCCLVERIAIYFYCSFVY